MPYIGSFKQPATLDTLYREAFDIQIVRLRLPRSTKEERHRMNNNLAQESPAGLFNRVRQAGLRGRPRRFVYDIGTDQLSLRAELADGCIMLWSMGAIAFMPATKSVIFPLDPSSAMGK